MDVCRFCPLSGETQVLAQVSRSAGVSTGTVGALASSHQPESFDGSDSWQAALLVYNSDDNRTSNSTDEVTISLRGLATQTGTRTSFSEWTQHPLRRLTSSPSCSVSPHLHPSPGLVYVTYNLDNSVSNPYQLWKDWARPDYPTVQQFRLLRSAQVGSPLLNSLSLAFSYF